jgi:hypothetical protein
MAGSGKVPFMERGAYFGSKGILIRRLFTRILEQVLRLDLEVTLFGEAIRFSSEMLTKV